MSNNPVFIGIDLGTSAVKVVAMEASGQIIRSASQAYPISYPHAGWAEQDPEDWWRATLDALREVLAVDGLGAWVRGISFSGQMHGLVVLDAEDAVVRPAILWNDGRSVEQCKYLNEVIGKERLLANTANIAFPGFTAPKLLWYRQNEPQNFRHTARYMYPKDFIIYRLTGEFATDYTDGVLMLDVHGKQWSPLMLELCSVRATQLPRLYQSAEAVGVVRPQIAKMLGLGDGVVVAAGSGDNAAAAVGTGTIGDGACNVSIGTSGTVFMSSSRFAMDKDGALHAFVHADGSYHLLGCILSAASCLSWWQNGVLKTDDFAREQERIKSLGDNDLYFLPYLMGERSPHNDADARGAFIGITPETTRGDMLQAVMEGVSFALADCVNAGRRLGIEFTSTKLCGGGARSHIWRRIIAAVLNMRVEIPAAQEAPALGAAIYAAVASGAYKDIASAVRAIVRTQEVIEPEPELVEKYARRLKVFDSLYPALAAVRFAHA